jgi:hypothetical protein
VTASGRQQEQRQADCEQQEHGFGGTHSKIHDLDIDVAVVVPAVIVMVLERALHGTGEAMRIEMGMSAAQLRPKEANQAQQQDRHGRSLHRRSVYAPSTRRLNTGAPDRESSRFQVARVLERGDGRAPMISPLTRKGRSTRP